VVLCISKRQLFLSWFFIGYWILKTGLHFHADPFFMPGIEGAMEKELAEALYHGFLSVSGRGESS
jgi:hypothetical protein